MWVSMTALSIWKLDQSAIMEKNPHFRALVCIIRDDYPDITVATYLDLTGAATRLAQHGAAWRCGRCQLRLFTQSGQKIAAQNNSIIPDFEL